MLFRQYVADPENPQAVKRVRQAMAIRIGAMIVIMTLAVMLCMRTWEGLLVTASSELPKILVYLVDGLQMVLFGASVVVVMMMLVVEPWLKSWLIDHLRLGSIVALDRDLVELKWYSVGDGQAAPVTAEQKFELQSFRNAGLTQFCDRSRYLVVRPKQPVA